MVVDVNLLVGRCPFRAVPAAPADLVALRSAAGLERAVASGSRTASSRIGGANDGGWSAAAHHPSSTAIEFLTEFEIMLLSAAASLAAGGGPTAGLWAAEGRPAVCTSGATGRQGTAE